MSTDRVLSRYMLYVFVIYIGPRRCRIGHAPFPGWRLYEAIKPNFRFLSGSLAAQSAGYLGY